MIFKLFGSQPQPYSQFNEPLCPFDLLTTFYIQNLVLCSAHSSALYEHILIKFQLQVIETHIHRKLTQPKNLGACTYAGIERLTCSGHSFVLHELILLKFQILVYYSRIFTTKRSQHQKRKQDHWLSNESLNITESHVSMFRIITNTTHIHTQRYLYV